MDDESFAEQLAQLDAVRPRAATLHPDGSLEVLLEVPGEDEPQTLAIEGTRTLLLLSGFEPRAMDLEGTGDKADAEARRVIDARLAQIKGQMRRRIEHAREQALQAVEVHHACPT